MNSASSDPQTASDVPADEPGEIVAGPGRYYRWARYVVAVGLLIGGGSWFFYDGFVKYPRQRALAERLDRENRAYEIKEKPHSDLDVTLNKLIGVTIPPLGVALLLWALYNSRGRYRLAGHTLYVPGHPPVPLDSIRQIDKTLWDRKGIAWIDYELPAPDGPAAGAPVAGRLKLDDFVYEQDKTDAILERIEQIIAPPEAPREESAAVAEGGPGPRRRPAA